MVAEEHIQRMVSYLILEDGRETLPGLVTAVDSGEVVEVMQSCASPEKCGVAHRGRVYEGGVSPVRTHSGVYVCDEVACSKFQKAATGQDGAVGRADQADCLSCGSPGRGGERF